MTVEPHPDQSIGLLIYQAIENKQVELLLKLFDRQKNSNINVSQYYPGIVTFCVKELLAARPSTDTDKLLCLWRYSVPQQLLSETDIHFSILALKKILGDQIVTKLLVADLVLALADVSPPSEPFFIDLALDSFSTLTNLSNEMFEKYKMKIGQQIIEKLNLLETFLSRETSDQGLSKIYSLIDSDYPRGESSRAITNCTTANPTHSFDAIIGSFFDWWTTDFIKIVHRLDVPSFPKNLSPFKSLCIRMIRNEINDIAIVIKSVTDRNMQRFLILWYLSMEEEIDRKKILKFVLFIVSPNDNELLDQCSSLLRSRVETKFGSLFTDHFRDIVFGSIVREIGEKSCHGSEFCFLITDLVAAGLPPSVLIDLVRLIIETYSPRNAPIWVMELLLTISFSLKTDPELGESNLLNPTQLIAIELIDFLKFFIDISVDEEHHENDPVANANICFIKSVFALRSIRNCLRIFLKSFPQIFIVKLCDFWTIFQVFLPTNNSIESQEDKLRLLFGLELVEIIGESDSSTKEFFENRIKETIVPLVENFSGNHDDICMKIISLVARMRQSGLLNKQHQISSS